MKIVAKIELLLIALWLGAACFFSFGVAPSAFSVLPSSELAGGVVNRTLSIINFSGVIIGILVLLTSFIGSQGLNKIRLWTTRIMLAILVAACGAGQLIIGVYLNHLRALIGKPIDELAADDPMKLQFDTWHQYSVWVLVAAMITALIAFFVISRSSSGSVDLSTPDEIPDFELPDELKM